MCRKFCLLIFLLMFVGSAYAATQIDSVVVDPCVPWVNPDTGETTDEYRPAITSLTIGDWTVSGLEIIHGVTTSEGAGLDQNPWYNPDALPDPYERILDDKFCYLEMYNITGVVCDLRGMQGGAYTDKNGPDKPDIFIFESVGQDELDCWVVYIDPGTGEEVQGIDIGQDVEEWSSIYDGDWAESGPPYGYYEQDLVGVYFHFTECLDDDYNRLTASDKIVEFAWDNDLDAMMLGFYGTPTVQVSSPSPADGEITVRCDVEEVCFYPPANALVMDPCADPNLKGPFDFTTYFRADDPCFTELDLKSVVLGHDTNDQICVNVGATLPGVTYYWRVDINDQNDGGNPVFYEGPEFSFTKWGYAHSPDPPDGSADMFPSVDPNWQNDGYAATFNVYFGEDEEDVDTAVVPDAVVAAGDEDDGYEPGPLLYGKTYYWRIDECNVPGCVHGNVWSFSTALCDPIDDFEPYTKSGGDNWIADTWGAYNSVPSVPDFDNGAYVYSMTTGDYPEKVYEGDKSMQMRYDVAWTA
ncbi:hypothetical protein ACFL1G_07985, partial [Planctomycetota bacterium]